jgi:hypothetical protein
MIRYNSTTDQYEGNTSVTGQAISTLQLTGTVTAILTTANPHGLSNGDYITVTGATPAAYNGSYNITYINATSFSYTMASNPGGNATVVGTYVAHLWSDIGGGATGGGTNQIFFENEQTVTADYTITTGRNAMSAGPITIDTGVTVAIPTNSTWVIV